MSGWTTEQVQAHLARIREGAGDSPLTQARKSLPEDTHRPKVTGILAKASLAPVKMNKTEQAFSDHLELCKRAGEVAWADFGCWTFRLGDDCRFTPDFPVLMSDGTFKIYDTKGRTKNKSTGASTAFSRDDSKVKIRVAARLYPMFRWFFVYQEKNGSWTEIAF